MAHIARMVAALSVVAVLASSAAGQTYGDPRTQRGDALDANPGVGTSGRNQTSASGRAIDSQLYISGRVSGLGSFRGSRPYAPVGSLQLDLPGASVRSFRQQSVGLQDAASGYAHRASPYLDRAQTVLGLRGIQSGLTSPGTNVPWYSTLAPQVADELYSTAIQRYQPLMDRQTPGLLLWQGPATGPLTAPVVRGQGLDAPDRFANTYRPGAGAILGVPWQDDREQLLAELNAVRRDRGADAQVGPARQDEQDDPRIGTRITGQPAGADESSVPAVARHASLMPEPGQDAFHDLMMAIREHEMEEAVPAGDQAGRPGRTGSLVTSSPSGSLVVTSLAGGDRDVFNRFMIDAQTLMLAGRYYDAGVKFGAAAMANPRNPFSQVGAALAMFAAGEPMSSAYRLRRAMEIFPPIMETQMAVAGMMDAAAFDQRLTELDTELTEQGVDDQMLLLLATYMHASTGNADQAKTYAQRLETAATDPLLAAYAKFILTGRRPDEQSAEQQND